VCGEADGSPAPAGCPPLVSTSSFLAVFFHNQHWARPLLNWVGEGQHEQSHVDRSSPARCLDADGRRARRCVRSLGARVRPRHWDQSRRRSGWWSGCRGGAIVGRRRRPGVASHALAGHPGSQQRRFIDLTGHHALTGTPPFTEQTGACSERRFVKGPVHAPASAPRSDVSELEQRHLACHE
jgi:hypothetical protein